MVHKLLFVSEMIRTKDFTSWRKVETVVINEEYFFLSLSISLLETLWIWLRLGDVMEAVIENLEGSWGISGIIREIYVHCLSVKNLQISCMLTQEFLKVWEIVTTAAEVGHVEHKVLVCACILLISTYSIWKL